MLMISVVIPLYNKGLYVTRAIESVLRQTYQDFEIIVVDDGSTDDGAQKVLALSDPRIRLIHQSNAGEGAARNRGIRESKGELIAGLDADDEWEENFLAAIVALRDRYPTAGIYATGYRTIYPRGLMVETTLLSDDHFLVYDYFVKARVAGIVTASSQAVPRQVYWDVGMFAEGEPMGCDLDMWGRIALRYPIAFDTRCLAIYHNEATGRAVPSYSRKKAWFPPFIRSFRCLGYEQIDPEKVAEIYEYMNYLLLRYLDSVIAVGDRKELQRVLRSEIYPTTIYKKEFAYLRIASVILPMWFVDFIRRLRSSRYISFLRNPQIKNGVRRRAFYL